MFLHTLYIVIKNLYTLSAEREVSVYPKNAWQLHREDISFIYLHWDLKLKKEKTPKKIDLKQSYKENWFCWFPYFYWVSSGCHLAVA